MKDWVAFAQDCLFSILRLCDVNSAAIEVFVNPSTVEGESAVVDDWLGTDPNSAVSALFDSISTSASLGSAREELLNTCVDLFHAILEFRYSRPLLAGQGQGGREVMLPRRFADLWSSS